MLRVAPDILRLQGLRSVYGLVARYFRDPRLRFIFSFHPLFIGGNPFQASAIFAMISYLERPMASGRRWAAPPRWCAASSG